MKKYVPGFVVVIVSAVTHFFYFGYPAQVVFDETFSGNFLSNYAKHTFFFDVHPPLAKLIVYIFGFLTGADYTTDMSSIGNPLPHSFILLRLVPLICGVLLPLIIYGISRKIGLSKLASMIAGILIAIENSLIVQSRFVLFDMIMLVFGFTSVLLYLYYRQAIENERSLFIKRVFLFGSALFAAGAFSIKWTGLSFPLLITTVEFLRMYRYETIKIKPLFDTFKKIITFVFTYFIIGLVVYTIAFAIHFSLLNKPGPGDAFMSEQFHQENFIEKIIDSNKEMYIANAYDMPQHQYQSSWWSWPIMLRPIFYWQGVNEYIYLLGNPFIYLFGTLSIILIFGGILFRKISKERNLAVHIISIGFIVNFVPFVFITRPMFLYHYEAALIISVMALALIIDFIKSKKWKWGIALIILAVCLAGFVYWSPLTYGLPLSQHQLEQRMWLSSWR
jgi:dolichyl-phosphate-mannose-protein mannosyltransferase